MNQQDEAPGVQTVDELRRAWDDMIEELQRARDAIDQPELMPAPQNDRNLAEGYRYLMGFAHSAIERSFFDDPERPVFQARDSAGQQGDNRQRRCGLLHGSDRWPPELSNPRRGTR